MNILDLSPEDFEASLKELGLEADREQFLRDEYAKKNTLSGQTAEAFQEATAVPEGKERAMIAPMIKPEGMSGLEAIRSGEAELAVPGFITGAVEGIGQALTTGEKVTRGIGVTEEELQQAAETGASLGLSGATTRIGKPLDRTVLSSGGASGSGKPFKPSMFSTGDIPLKPSAYSVAEFYSPVVETIRNAEFPSKGYKGSELLKLLQDKTPGVRKAELDAMDLGIDPQKRYTQEELLDLAQRRSYKVTAEVVDNDLYATSQRQDIRDQEVDYATIKVNATPNSEEVPAFLPTRGYTHYDPETVAHTRMSIREGQGGEYALIEEIQSDLLQHGVTKPRGAITVDEAYEEVLDIVAGDIAEDPKLKPVYDTNQEYFDNLFKIGAENARQFALREKGLGVPAEDVQRLEALVERTRSLADKTDRADEKSFQKLATMFENSGYDEGYRIDRRTAPVGKSPLRRGEDSDAVRLTLQAAIAKAADSGVNSLVIPNVERIVAADRARPGSEQYFDYVNPESGFTRTYVRGVEKFIKQLQDQYGDAIKVERVELPYTKEHYYYEGQQYVLPTSALKIDFSGIEGVDFRVSRFAEGGMVEDNQMKRLFQEGGMTDDGMDVEPVTGNEIPPGSMASEVRDNIPAQLSEGEYIVPADVVRFFGVKFFEDLRAQAKQGLTEMDKDGRIGGTPVDQNGVPVEDEEELSPEEEEMLREVLGATGMAEGGLATPGFDRTQFSLGSTSGVESRKYYNPATKETRTVQFMNGVAIGAIPAGFVPWTQELEAQSQTATTGTPVQTPEVKAPAPTGSDRNEPVRTTPVGVDRKDSGSYDKWAEENFEAITSNPYQFGIDALSDKSGRNLTGGLAGVGLLAGGPAGSLALLGAGANRAYNRVENIAGAKAALIQMEAQGKKGSEQYNNLEKLIDSQVQDLPLLQRLAVEADVMATGVNYANAVSRRKETAAPTTTPTPAQQRKAATGVGTSVVREKGAGNDKDVVPKTGGTTPAKTGGSAAGKQLSKAPTPKTPATRAPAQTPAKKESIEQKLSRGGGFQKGGLVTKPQKKSKKPNKGLAS